MDTTHPNEASPTTFEPHFITLSDHTPTPSRRSTNDPGLPEPATVPCLRLAGKWLQNAGFARGMRVRIEVSQGRLTIEPITEPPASTPQPRRVTKPRPSNLRV